MNNNHDDAVILLHGLLRTRFGMRGLAAYLKKSGFQVLNLGYASTKYSLEQLVDIIHPDIEHFISPISGKIHFVGYSMGGLLIRAYLKKYRPTKLGRVVLVGTPNHGSEVADFLKELFLYKKIYGPAGQQVITHQDPFKNIFTDTDFELGTIAGNKPINFIGSAIIGKPNDGLVSVESTKLEGAKDHIILPCNHTFFTFNKTMWQQVLHFLKYGQFRRTHS